MTIETWLVYVATVLALMCTPGPSQLLMLSNSGTHGFGRSLATAAGDLSANALQMFAAGLGLAALISASATALMIIKWAGVAYLIWLGLQMIRSTTTELAEPLDSNKTVSLQRLWMQGFLTSAANPKAVIFFAALFPQFISSSQPFWSQFVILSLTYIVIDGCFLSVYGFGADWIVRHLRGASKARVNLVGGIFMIIAAILLGFKSVERQI